MAARSSPAIQGPQADILPRHLCIDLQQGFPMTEQTSDRIRAAVEKNPRKMTLQLARDLGVPEVEVIRAFPTDRVVELDIAQWEELLQSLEAFGSVRVLVSNGATTIEVDGHFG